MRLVRPSNGHLDTTERVRKHRQRSLRVADSLTVADLATLQQVVVANRELNIGDAVAVADLLETLESSQSVTIADTVALADLVTAQGDRDVNIADAVALSDLVVTQGPRRVTVTDTAALTDHIVSLLVSTNKAVSIVDAVTLADLVATLQGHPTTQASNLRSRHVPNIVQNWYVDSLNGNDTTGTGTTGAPWKTLQKAHDYLASTATWPALGTGDVAVNIRPTAPYKALSTQQQTLFTSFSNGARAPAANRRLIWRKDPAYSPRPVINNPDGISNTRVAIEIGSGSLNSYQIFSGLNIDGERVRKGTFAGGSCGIYLSGGSANANTHIEVWDTRIHGFLIGTEGGNATSQGMFVDDGGSFLLLDRVEVDDNGAADDFYPSGNHGIYVQAPDVQITNSSFHDNQSGFGAQFYNGGSATFPRLTVANSTFDNNFASGILVHGDEDSVSLVNLIITNHTGRGNSSHGIEFFPAATGGAVGSRIDHVVYDGNFDNRSATPAGWTITNELTADPMYVTPGSDRHLQAGSPAIGYTDTTYCYAYDLEGTARVAGSEDAGAYEYTP